MWSRLAVLATRVPEASSFPRMRHPPSIARSTALTEIFGLSRPYTIGAPLHPSRLGARLFRGSARRSQTHRVSVVAIRSTKFLYRLHTGTRFSGRGSRSRVEPSGTRSAPSWRRRRRATAQTSDRWVLRFQNLGPPRVLQLTLSQTCSSRCDSTACFRPGSLTPAIYSMSLRTRPRRSLSRPSISLPLIFCPHHHRIHRLRGYLVIWS